MFRCPYCSTLHLNKATECRLCHSTFIDPNEYDRFGEDVVKRYKDCGVYKIF